MHKVVLHVVFWETLYEILYAYNVILDKLFLKFSNIGID